MASEATARIPENFILVRSGRSQVVVYGCMNGRSSKIVEYKDRRSGHLELRRSVAKLARARTCVRSGRIDLGIPRKGWREGNTGLI